MEELENNIKCSCGNIGTEELHSCPYQIEINGNDDEYCNCCNICENNCAQDI